MLPSDRVWERWQVPERVALRGSLAERRPGDVVATFIILNTERSDPYKHFITGCR